MGLGKTLQTIMLILKNPAPEGWAIKDYSEAKGAQSVKYKSHCKISSQNSSQMCGRKAVSCS